MMQRRLKGFSALETLVAMVIVAGSIVTYVATFTDANKGSYLQLVTFRADLYTNDVIENSYTSPLMVKQLAEGGALSQVNCRRNSCNAEQYASYTLARIQARAEKMLRPVNGNISVSTRNCVPDAPNPKYWDFSVTTRWRDKATDSDFRRNTTVDRAC